MDCRERKEGIERVAEGEVRFLESDSGFPRLEQNRADPRPPESDGIFHRRPDTHQILHGCFWWTVMTSAAGRRMRDKTTATMNETTKKKKNMSDNISPTDAQCCQKRSCWTINLNPRVIYLTVSSHLFTTCYLSSACTWPPDNIPSSSS